MPTGGEHWRRLTVMKTKSALTRERLLATAEALILEKGFSGTTIHDIVQASELSKGAFFFHFKHKADLARAVVERFWKNDYELFRGFAERAKRSSPTIRYRRR